MHAFIFGLLFKNPFACFGLVLKSVFNSLFLSQDVATLAPAAKPSEQAAGMAAVKRDNSFGVRGNLSNALCFKGVDMTNALYWCEYHNGMGGCKIPVLGCTINSFEKSWFQNQNICVHTVLQNELFLMTQRQTVQVVCCIESYPPSCQVSASCQSAVHDG